MTHVVVNRQAPVVGVAEAVLFAPIETVWEVLSDFPRWPSWNKQVSKIRREGAVEVGSTFVWVAGGSRIVSRLEEVDAPSRIAWSGRTLGLQAVHVWQLEREERGTRVITEESFEGWAAKWFPGLMRKVLAKTLRQGVDALKVEAESRAGGR